MPVAVSVYFWENQSGSCTFLDAGDLLFSHEPEKILAHKLPDFVNFEGLLVLEVYVSGSLLSELTWISACL